VAHQHDSVVHYQRAERENVANRRLADLAARHEGNESAWVCGRERAVQEPEQARWPSVPFAWSRVTKSAPAPSLPGLICLRRDLARWFLDRRFLNRCDIADENNQFILCCDFGPIAP
jgi:hypothetical protein